MSEQSIFHDLNIDINNIMTDPEVFARECHEWAVRLNEIMEGKETPVERAVRQIIAGASGEKSEKAVAFHSAIRNFDWRELTDDDLASTLKFLDEFRNSIMVELEDRVMSEHNLNVKSKRLASHLYKKLRRGYEAFLQYQKTFHPETAKTFKMIPAKPGNYSDSVRFNIYIFENEEFAFWNYPAMKLGIRDQIKFEGDFVDYVRANPDCGVRIVEG